jgi:hypothetical protein
VCMLQGRNCSCNLCCSSCPSRHSN